MSCSRKDPPNMGYAGDVDGPDEPALSGGGTLTLIWLLCC